MSDSPLPHTETDNYRTDIRMRPSRFAAKQERKARFARRHAFLEANPHPGHVHPPKVRKTGAALTKAVNIWRENLRAFDAAEAERAA